MSNLNFYPTGDYSIALSTRGGSHYSCVRFDDSAYVYTTSGTYLSDLYNFTLSDLPYNAVVSNIRLVFLYRCFRGFNAYLKPFLYDGTERLGSQFNTHSTEDVTNYQDFNPATYGWSTADIKDLRAGLKLKTSDGDEARCNQFRMVITYSLSTGRSRSGFVFLEMS